MSSGTFGASDDVIMEIARRGYYRLGLTQRDLAVLFGVSRESILFRFRARGWKCRPTGRPRKGTKKANA